MLDDFRDDNHTVLILDDEEEDAKGLPRSSRRAGRMNPLQRFLLSLLLFLLVAIAGGFFMVITGRIVLPLQ
jgi:hypothetical protein